MAFRYDFGRNAAIRLALGIAFLVASSIAGHARDCRLALVLALDVSSSMDEREYTLQREGLARALTHPDIVGSIVSPHPVALYVFEWSSTSKQKSLLSEWLVISSKDDLIKVAEILRTAPGVNSGIGTTGLGSALVHASRALEEEPNCLKKTVDVSGDGRNNVGISPRQVYSLFPFHDVTVNALVVGGEQPGARRKSRDQDLVEWFRKYVLHGPGAFLIFADNYDDFQRAMREKLLRETTTVQIGSR